MVQVIIGILLQLLISNMYVQMTTTTETQAIRRESGQFSMEHQHFYGYLEIMELSFSFTIITYDYHLQLSMAILIKMRVSLAHPQTHQQIAFVGTGH